MRALDDIRKDRRYEREVSCGTISGCFSSIPLLISTHPDFIEAFRLWTQKDNFRGLDFARVWSLALNEACALETRGIAS